MSLGHIELLPPSRRHALRMRARIRRWGVIAGAYAVVTAGLCGTIARGDTELVQLTMQREAAEKRAAAFKDTLTSTRAKSAAQQARLRASEIVAQHPDWSRLLKRLSVMRGESVVFDRLDIVPTPAGRELMSGPNLRVVGKTGQERQAWYTINLAGRGRSHQAVTEMLQRFEDEKLFERVDLGQMSSGDSGLVRFTATCTLGEGSVREEKGR